MKLKLFIEHNATETKTRGSLWRDLWALMNQQWTTYY